MVYRTGRVLSREVHGVVKDHEERRLLVLVLVLGTFERVRDGNGRAGEASVRGEMR